MDKEILASLALVVGASVILILTIGSAFCQCYILYKAYVEDLVPKWMYGVIIAYSLVSLAKAWLKSKT